MLTFRTKMGLRGKSRKRLGCGKWKPRGMGQSLGAAGLEWVSWGVARGCEGQCPARAGLRSSLGAVAGPRTGFWGRFLGNLLVLPS